MVNLTELSPVALGDDELRHLKHLEEEFNRTLGNSVYLLAVSHKKEG